MPGLLVRDVTRVLLDASRGIFSVFARHLPGIASAGRRAPEAVPAAVPAEV